MSHLTKSHIGSAVFKFLLDIILRIHKINNVACPVHMQVTVPIVKVLMGTVQQENNTNRTSQALRNANLQDAVRVHDQRISKNSVMHIMLSKVYLDDEKMFG